MAPDPNLPPIAGGPRRKVPKVKDEVEYYRHQIEGIRTFLSLKASWLLTDDMGLGKSLSALTTAAIAMKLDQADGVLIVVPATLKRNWAEDIEKHTKFTYHILEGNPKQRQKQLDDFDADILIVGYEQVIAHWEQFNDMGFQIAIYDEAHYMGNRKSKRTKACQQLTMGRHFLLTGSPMLGQIDDLWTLLNRVAPDEFPNYWTFINRYAVYGGYMNKQIIGVKNEKELRDKVYRHMLRREKKDCLDLPEKQYIPITLDLLPEQRVLYAQARDEMKIDIPGTASPMEINNAMTKFQRLIQITSTTACIEGHPDFSVKLDVAVEKIREIIAGGEPVVVFTQFRKVLACLAARLEAAGFTDVPQLHGDVKQEQRIPIVQEWTKDAIERGRPKPILCMYQVAGVGLNMTAASKLIAIDRLFVPKLNEQAEDRLHRIGQRRTVQIIILRTRNTVETKVEKILSTKKGVFGSVISVGDTSWKKKLIDAIIAEDD